MAQLLTALYAERVAVDRFSNKLDILGVIERIGVPQAALETAAAQAALPKKKRQPVRMQTSFALLLYWRRKDLSKPEGKLQTKVEIRSPSGELMGSGLQEIDLAEHVFVRGVFHFNLMPFGGIGAYTTSVFVRARSRWVRAGETTFDVTVEVPAAVKKSKTSTH